MRMPTVRQLVLSATMITGLLLGGILSPRAATAATYYVATDGNDADQGTESRPFGTIKKGLSVMQAGDTLYLRDGTYNEGIDSQNQTIPSGTSWSTPVTIGAYPGETVTLNGSVNINGYRSTVYQYIIVDGFILNQKQGFIGGSNAHHVRVQNGEVKNSPHHGLQVFTSHHIEFINLKVHSNGADRLSHGFYVCGNDMTIRDCDVYENSGYGIHVYNSADPGCSTNTQIYNNTIHDNRGDGGVTLNHGDNILFYNNFVYNNLSGVEVSYGNPTNTQIDSNTIHNNRGGITISTSSRETIIKNNSLYQNVSAIDDHGIGTRLENNTIE
jgi:parallel beta-helix repeat protein